MSSSEQDRLAALVIDRHCAFERALAASRKRYPTREFRSFAAVMRREHKRAPDKLLLEAERLECLLFLGYHPHFDGDEPPGL
ncbi:MAG TPA: hypothetical protein VG206_14650 [Terriglobia bacterium]|nr:hypothetical protein [Terriglobia bacterium]